MELMTDAAALALAAWTLEGFLSRETTAMEIVARSGRASRQPSPVTEITGGSCSAKVVEQSKNKNKIEKLKSFKENTSERIVAGSKKKVK